MLGLGLGLARPVRPAGGGGPPPTPMTLYLRPGTLAALPSFRILATTGDNTFAEIASGLGDDPVEVLITDGTTPAQFASGRAPTGGFTLPAGAVSFNVGGANTGNTPNKFRAKLLKRATGGAETLIGTFDDDAQMAATYTMHAWSGAIAAPVSFLEDERLLVRFYIAATNGGAVTGNWIAMTTSDAALQSSFVIPATVAWKAEA